MLGEIRQDQIGRHRRNLVEPRFAQLALDIEIFREAEAAVSLDAHVPGSP